MLVSQMCFINQINIIDLTGHFFVFSFLVGVTRLKVNEGKMDSAGGIVEVCLKLSKGVYLLIFK